MNISLSLFAPENLVPRDRFGRPVLLTRFLPISAAASIYHIAIRHRVTPSGQANAYRWRSLSRVRRHRASSPQGSSKRALPSHQHGPINMRLFFPGAPICNTALQHFSCNMIDAIRTIPHETLPFFEVLWVSALFAPGCCGQLARFEFGVLNFRLPLYTRNGQVGEHILLLWFLALVLAGCCCQLVCFECCGMLCFISVCLYPKRAEC